MTILEIFTTLVQIDSPSGHERALAEWIQQFLRDTCQFTATIAQNNNVFVQTPGVGEPLFFNAHLDTVEPGRGIVPKIQDGYVVSAGTTILGADNKVAVAGLLWALQENARQPEQKIRPLDILFTSSEETGNYGAIEFDRTQLRAKEGFIFDLEGELGTIISQAPYYARFSLTIIGKSAHAARRNQAIEIISPLLSILQQIESLRTPELLINVGSIHGGQARNTVLGELQLEGEIRSFHEEAFLQAQSELQDICTFSPESSLKIALKIVTENPGYIHTPESLQKVSALFEKHLGKPVIIEPSYGCSDANIFNENLEQLRVYNVSDGSENAHTVDERVSLQNLEALGELIRALMQSTA